MAGPVNGSRAEYVYNSDNGKSYEVSHSTPKAVAGGFGIGPSSGGLFPRAWRMRGVYGVILGSGTADNAPAKTFLPIADASNPLFTQSTSTFSVTYPWGTVTYTVTGIRGEKRYHLHPA
jgi:hypothetical protein